MNRERWEQIKAERKTNFDAYQRDGWQYLDECFECIESYLHFQSGVLAAEASGTEKMTLDELDIRPKNAPKTHEVYPGSTVCKPKAKGIKKPQKTSKKLKPHNK